MNLYVIIVACIASSSASPVGDASVRQATLERAIEMMEGNDDWMNTIKFMMKNSTRGFKVESRRVLEYEGETAGFEENPPAEDGQPGGRTLLTMVNNPVPSLDMAYNSRSLSTRTAMPENSMERDATTVPHTQIMVGNVGVCTTSYEVQRIFSAPLLSDPTGTIATLANPMPAMVGSCARSHPTSDIGSNQGRCVLSAQPYAAWILVPSDARRGAQNCVEIPGVTSLVRCSDWIIIAGRCVYDLEPSKN